MHSTGLIFTKETAEVITEEFAAPMHERRQREGVKGDLCWVKADFGGFLGHRPEFCTLDPMGGKL